MAKAASVVATADEAVQFSRRVLEVYNEFPDRFLTFLEEVIGAYIDLRVDEEQGAAIADAIGEVIEDCEVIIDMNDHGEYGTKPAGINQEEEMP